MHLPNSRLAFTDGQLHDLFFAPDWHPDTSRIPRMMVMGWIYVADPRGGEESLGQRVIECAPDGNRHEQRDDQMRYIAFVPPGSLKRGREIATGRAGSAQACISCHGDHLRGVGLIPPLAGRSPTYLLRELVAFRNHDRTGASAAPMQLVSAHLTVSDMIAVTAYAAAQ